jgi:hypothetical protein
MFCPKCGQQQASDEMRFCSRCGFQLGVVSALVATGGAPPAVIITDNKGESKLAVKRSARQGAKLMFASGVLTPIAMGFSILFDSPWPLIIPFTIFLAGLAWMLYFRWFGEEVSFSDHQSYPTQLAGAKQDYLPPSKTPVAAVTGSQSHRTAEIVQPPSVTEHTTRLLDAEKENP